MAHIIVDRSYVVRNGKHWPTVNFTPFTRAQYCHKKKQNNSKRNYWDRG